MMMSSHNGGGSSSSSPAATTTAFLTTDTCFISAASLAPAPSCPLAPAAGGGAAVATFLGALSEVMYIRS